MTDQELIMKYPWIRAVEFRNEPVPTNIWAFPEIPEGWRASFIEDMCAEIDAELQTWTQLARDNYYLIQVKEKYGTLRWYDSTETPKLEQIITKYEQISMNTCFVCGKPATLLSSGWILPYCDECAANAKFPIIPLKHL